MLISYVKQMAVKFLNCNITAIGTLMQHTVNTAKIIQYCIGTLIACVGSSIIPYGTIIQNQQHIAKFSFFLDYAVQIRIITAQT